MTLTVTASDGARLAVSEHGDPSGATVVCVHGYPDNRSMWDGVVAELADRHRVVTYDVRGAGESDGPGARASYRLDRLVGDLAAVLDTVSPDSPVHLLAHDWGSIQSWHAVTDFRFHDRIRSFTSISGPCLDHAGHWMRDQLRGPSPRGLRNLARQLVRSGYIGFFQLPAVPELAWRAGIVQAAVSRLGGRTDRPALRDGLNGLELYRANITRRFRNPEPRRTEVPVQVLAPTRDAFVTVPLQTDVGRWVSDLRVRHVDGGHWAPLKHPGTIARHVSELVGHVEGGPRSRTE